MSTETRVDVLAVMDAASKALSMVRGAAILSEDLKVVAAAVSKLIEAAEDVERRAGPDREPRLRAALSTIRSTL